MELITAEKLKDTIRATTNGLVYLPAEGRAHQTKEGWLLSCGPYVLRSARIKGPRHFRSLDALYNAAHECGLDKIAVSVGDLAKNSDEYFKKFGEDTPEKLAELRARNEDK